MKSVRSFIGIVLFVLCLHQSIHTAASEPVIPRSNSFKEVIVEASTPFDELESFVPSSRDFAYTEDVCYVQHAEKGKVTSSRTIAVAEGMTPVQEHRLYKKKKTERKRMHGTEGDQWRRICKSYSYIDEKKKKRTVPAHWEKSSEIVGQKDLVKMHYGPHLTTPNDALAQHIAHTNDVLAQLQYEKETMLHVVKQRTLHAFAAYNTCIGSSKDCSERKKRLLEKKCLSKKAEQETLSTQLAEYGANRIQRQAAIREAQTNDFWAPTKDMSQFAYMAYCTAYGMSAPSSITVEEAIQTEFALPESKDKKQHVPMLVARAKKIWPTLDDALKAAHSLPQDILDQEHVIRNLEEAAGQTSKTEDKKQLQARIVEENKKLQQLKMLRFVNLLKCESDLSHLERSLQELDTQIALYVENATQSKGEIKKLLATALYDTRAAGHDVIEAIQIVFDMPYEQAEYLSYFYTENNALQEPKSAAEQSNCLQLMLQTKQAEIKKLKEDMAEISVYESYLTHQLPKRSVSLAIEDMKERKGDKFNKALLKKQSDIATGNTSDYAKHIAHLSTHKVTQAVKTHGPKIEDALKLKQEAFDLEIASDYEQYIIALNSQKVTNAIKEFGSVIEGALQKQLATI